MTPVRDRVVLEVDQPGLVRERPSGLAEVTFSGQSGVKSNIAFRKGTVAFIGPKVKEEAPEIEPGRTVHYNMHLTGFIDIPTPTPDKTAYIVMGPADIVAVE